MLQRTPQVELLDTSQHGVRVSAFSKDCVDSHWHFHPEVELVWLESGQGVLHAGQALWPYSAGQLILLGGNLPHAYGSAASQRNGAKWLVLHFRPSLWGEDFWNLPENSRIRDLLSRAGCGCVYSGEIARQCAAMLLRMGKGGAAGMPLARLLDLLEVLSHAKASHQLNPQPVSVGKEAPMDSRLRQVLDRLEQVLHDPELTQAEVAGWVKMSPQAFCRYFKQQSGRRFQHHLNELRIARACANLLGSEQSVAQIAYEAGFNNLSNFNRRFREFTGFTPRLYRQTKGGLTQ